ncbi:hypothetical protein Hanom_Chr07g00657311 [Helianthus anomalus]
MTKSLFYVVLNLSSMDMSLSLECCCSFRSLTISTINTLMSLLSPLISSSIPNWPTSVHGCFSWANGTTFLLLIVF